MLELEQMSVRVKEAESPTREAVNSELVLLGDGCRQTPELVAILEQIGRVTTLPLADVYRISAAKARCVVVDVDLSAVAAEQELQHLHELSRRFSLPLIFVVDRNDSNDAVDLSLRKAKDLGATNFFMRPFDSAEVMRIIPTADGQAFEHFIAKRNGITGRGVVAAHRVLTSMMEAARAKQAFTYEQVRAQEETILEALHVAGIRCWLNAVRRHHSRTYRHSLLVTGFGVAFAQKLGMRQDDQRRIARAALLHDIGKAFIPLGILDKPGKLTEAEMNEIKRHPVLGYDSLVSQGGFPAEILDCVRHHHELLDGSGYPDGLFGDEIVDLVRITTIADIHSALIEERAYKHPLPASQALSIMEAMGSKLDADLLRAFRPVASDAEMRG